MPTVSPLPTEILSQIFEKAYAHTVPYRHCYKPASHVIRLTHVSRRWRQIALSLPQLWRCIHIGPSQPLTELFLSRSGKHPLFVTFSEVEGPLRHSQQQGMPVIEWPALYYRHLDALLQDARRIAHLVIRTDSVLLMTEILPRIPPLPLSRLNYLDLTLDNFLVPIAPLQLRLPELRCLRLGTIPISFSACHFPSLQTAYLEVGELTGEALHALATNAPHLSDLTISESYFLDDFSPLAPFLHLEALTFERVDELESFLYSLDVPALSSLTIVSVRFEPTWLRSEKPPPTFPAVTRLCLQAVTTDEYDVFGYILRYTPNISSLAFRGTDTAHYNFFLYLAGFSEMGPPLLKSLKTLYLADITKVKNEADVLIGFVETRTERQCPLEELILGKDVCDRICEDDVRRLNEMTRVTFASDTELVSWQSTHADRFYLTL